MKTLREARQEKDMTLQCLSELCNVSIVTLSNIERGKQMPYPGTRKKIEAFMGKIDWMETHMKGFLR